MPQHAAWKGVPSAILRLQTDPPARTLILKQKHDSGVDDHRGGGCGGMGDFRER